MSVAKYFKASQVQPGAWWLLGLSFSILAGTSRNPFVLCTTIAFLILIILGAREHAPWSQSLRFYLLLGLSVVGIRVVFRTIFNYGLPDSHPLLSLPLVSLNFGPLGEVALFGAVSSSAIFSALIDGLRISAIILGAGMANSLANPRRLLKATPGALYEIAAALAVAFNLAPQIIVSAQRVNKARSLRGRSKGLSALNSLIIPILEDAIEQSLNLAASMDARGFGRQGSLSIGQLRYSRIASLTAVACSAIGTYVLLTSSNGGFALSLFGLAALATFTTLRIASRRNIKTRYVKAPWRAQDFCVLTICLTLILLATSGWLS
jgi:energy-coupling factor transport system permease protein